MMTDTSDRLLIEEYLPLDGIDAITTAPPALRGAGSLLDGKVSVGIRAEGALDRTKPENASWNRFGNSDRLMTDPGESRIPRWRLASCKGVE